MKTNKIAEIEPGSAADGTSAADETSPLDGSSATDNGSEPTKHSGEDDVYTAAVDKDSPVASRLNKRFCRKAEFYTLEAKKHAKKEKTNCSKTQFRVSLLQQ